MNANAKHPRCEICGCTHCDLTEENHWLCDECEEQQYLPEDGPTMEDLGEEELERQWREEGYE